MTLLGSVLKAVILLVGIVFVAREIGIPVTGVVAGHEGYVKTVGLRSTQIRTREDSVVSIPNSILANEIIDNLGRRRHRRIKARLGVEFAFPTRTLLMGGAAPSPRPPEPA